MAVQVVDVALRAGEEVVETQDLVTLIQQSIEQVRPDEAGTAGHDDAFAAVIEAGHQLSLSFLSFRWLCQRTRIPRTE